MIRRLVRALAARLRRPLDVPPPVHRRIDDGWPYTDLRISAEMRTPWR